MQSRPTPPSSIESMPATWRERWPWLILLRTFRLAIDVRKLLMAALALALTAAGWWSFAQIFAGAGDPVLQATAGVAQVWPWNPSAETAVTSTLPGGLGRAFSLDGVWQMQGPFLAAWGQLVEPFVQLFNYRLSIAGFTYFLLCALWAVAVWALFGGAITRIATVELALEERVPLSQALGFSRSHWPSYFWAPLFPLVGILIVVVLMSIVSWLLRFDLGVLLLSIIWPLYLLAAFFMAIVLLGLVVGWPLMWATISSEGTDMFDALSRSYSYVYQRPLHYLFYAVVAVLFGLLTWLLVSLFASAVVYLSFWGASWTAGAERTEQLLQHAAPFNILDTTRGAQQADENVSTALRAGASLIGFWAGCVNLLALGFVFSYFWTASTAIYLLLRRDTDATEMDEVFVEGLDERHSLPPLKTDTAGVPLADADESVESPSDADGERPGAAEPRPESEEPS